MDAAAQEFVICRKTGDEDSAEASGFYLWHLRWLWVKKNSSARDYRFWSLFPLPNHFYFYFF